MLLADINLLDEIASDDDQDQQVSSDRHRSAVSSSGPARPKTAPAEARIQAYGASPAKSGRSSLSRGQHTSQQPRKAGEPAMTARHQPLQQGRRSEGSRGSVKQSRDENRPPPQKKPAAKKPLAKSDPVGCPDGMPKSGSAAGSADDCRQDFPADGLVKEAPSDGDRCGDANPPELISTKKSNLRAAHKNHQRSSRDHFAGIDPLKHAGHVDRPARADESSDDSKTRAIPPPHPASSASVSNLRPDGPQPGTDGQEAKQQHAGASAGAPDADPSDDDLAGQLNASLLIRNSNSRASTPDCSTSHSDLNGPRHRDAGRSEQPAQGSEPGRLNNAINAGPQHQQGRHQEEGGRILGSSDMGTQASSQAEGAEALQAPGSEATGSGRNGQHSRTGRTRVASLTTVSPAAAAAAGLPTPGPDPSCQNCNARQLIYTPLQMPGMACDQQFHATSARVSVIAMPVVRIDRAHVAGQILHAPAPVALTLEPC